MAGYVNATANIQAAQTAVQAALGDVTKVIENPVIPMPYTDGVVELPGGLLTPENVLLTEVEVRELTGRDEEVILKARMTGKYSRFMRSLLKAGVVSIGGKEVTDDILDDLLIGDREAIILGIRRATYGDEVELTGVGCQECGTVTDLIVTLDDIPTRSMEDPKKRTYDVPLRKGGFITLRLQTGADQVKVFDNPNITVVAEQNSIILGCCMISRTFPDGKTAFVDSANAARDLGVVDRKALLEVLEKNQPGPRYEDIVHPCGNCGAEVPLSLNVGDLFFR